MVAEQQSVRAYPQPYGINLAHVLGYLSRSPRTELDQAAGGRRHVAQRGVGRSAAPASRRSTTGGCAACPATRASRSTRWAGCSATKATGRGAAGDTLVTCIDARVRVRRRRQLARDHRDRAGDPRPVTAATTSPTRARRRDGGRDRPDRRDGQPAEGTTEVWVGGTTKSSSPGCLRGPDPLLGRATAGPVRARLDVEAVHDRALTDGHHDTRLNCSSGLQVATGVQDYESGAYGYIGFDEALEVLHTSTGSASLLAAPRLGSSPTWTPRTRWWRGRRRLGPRPASTSGRRRRIADRKWKREYYEAIKDYYCGIDDKPQDAEANEGSATSSTLFAGASASRATPTGRRRWRPPRSARAHHPHAELARAYAALAGRWAPCRARVGRAIVADGTRGSRDRAKKIGTVDVPVTAYIRTALKAWTSQAPWPGGSVTPARPGEVRRDRSARSTAVRRPRSRRHRRLRRGDDGQPGRYGRHRPTAVRTIWKTPTASTSGWRLPNAAIPAHPQRVPTS